MENKKTTTLKDFQPKGKTHWERLQYLANAVNATHEKIKKEHKKLNKT